VDRIRWPKDKVADFRGITDIMTHLPRNCPGALDDSNQPFSGWSGEQTNRVKSEKTEADE